MAAGESGGAGRATHVPLAAPRPTALPKGAPRPGCCENWGGSGWGRESRGRAGVRPTSVFTWAEAGCGGVPAVVAAGGGCCCCCG